ncbi:hypothetical protein C808_03092 [Lachnospiraceae bacterium M18-1]|nr:hypothetical protein C808_03092 [Lachnospiraceae bacterium M18-1]
MNLADKLALIVCEQCKRNENESDVDFSTRLLSVYNSCYDNIANILQQEDQSIVNESVNDFLINN